MASPATITRPVYEMSTDQFDPIDFIDDRFRRRSGAVEPGRYFQIDGPKDTVLIPIADGVTHIGRGLAADLHLDHTSVSRRHAILLSTPRGARILDDRSYSGTMVNGRPLDEGDLRSGDIITLGDVTLKYLEA